MKKYIYILLSIISVNVYAQEESFVFENTSVGGYGELHYNYSKPEGADEAKTGLDFHRFIIFISHSWNEKWSFKSELELEHNFVHDGEGELELEQAYVNYFHAPWFGFQAGVILPSVGLINEYHEPPLFLSVERPDYAKNIIPTTWFGNGAAVYGIVKGFDYRFAVMEGLNSDNFSLSSGIRGGRQKGYKPSGDNLLYNLRVNYLNIPGLLAGVSYTYNNAEGDSTNVPVNLIEFHAAYNKGGFYTVFEIGNISYDDYRVKNSRGWYLDLGYNIGSLVDWETQVIPFIRYSNINTVSESAASSIMEDNYHNTKIMAGLSVKPLPEVVFKADFSVMTRQSDDRKTNLFNLGVGYMF